MKTNHLTTYALAAAAVAAFSCGKKEEPPAAPSEPPPPVERNDAEPAPPPGETGMNSEEQQVVDGVPTMEDAQAAAAKDVSDENADAVLAEIRKELGSGN